MSGDHQTLRFADISEQASTPEEARDIVNSVIKRAQGMEFITDPTVSGLKTNAEERQRIGKQYRTPKPATELEQLHYRDSLDRAMGYPFGGKPITLKKRNKTQRIDELMAAGYTKSGALDFLQK